jgi:hypothetical protein
MPTFYLPTLTLFLHGESWNSHKNVTKDCRVSEVPFFLHSMTQKAAKKSAESDNKPASDSSRTEIRNAHKTLVE